MKPDTSFVPAVGCPGYLVSHDGRVIGRKGWELKQWLDQGYPRLNIWADGGAFRPVYVHRIVCETFHGPPPSKEYEVAHGDGNPANNTAHNLRWATRKENADDRARHGRTLQGIKHPLSKLTEEDVRSIRRLRTEGVMGIEVARMFGISPSKVCQIHKRQSWTHLD